MPQHIKVAPPSKITAYLSTDALKSCDSSMLLLGLKSRSTYIEQPCHNSAYILTAKALFLTRSNSSTIRFWFAVSNNFIKLAGLSNGGFNNSDAFST